MHYENIRKLQCVRPGDGEYRVRDLDAVQPALVLERLSDGHIGGVKDLDTGQKRLVDRYMWRGEIMSIKQAQSRAIERGKTVKRQFFVPSRSWLQGQGGW